MRKTYLSIYTFLLKIGDWSPNRPLGKRFETNIPSRMPMDRSLNNANRTWRIATKIVRTINYIMPNVLHVSRLQLGC